MALSVPVFDGVLLALAVSQTRSGAASRDRCAEATSPTQIAGPERSFARDALRGTAKLQSAARQTTIKRARDSVPVWPAARRGLRMPEGREQSPTSRWRLDVSKWPAAELFRALLHRSVNRFFPVEAAMFRPSSSSFLSRLCVPLLIRFAGLSRCWDCWRCSTLRARQQTNQVALSSH